MNARATGTERNEGEGVTRMLAGENDAEYRAVSRRSQVESD